MKTLLKVWKPITIMSTFIVLVGCLITIIWLSRDFDKIIALLQLILTIAISIVGFRESLKWRSQLSETRLFNASFELYNQLTNININLLLLVRPEPFILDEFPLFNQHYQMICDEGKKLTDSKSFLDVSILSKDATLRDSLSHVICGITYIQNLHTMAMKLETDSVGTYQKNLIYYFNETSVKQHMMLILENIETARNCCLILIEQ